MNDFSSSDRLIGPGGDGHGHMPVAFSPSWPGAVGTHFGHGSQPEQDGGWFNPETVFRYWRVLMRRRRLIAGVTLIFAVIGLLIALLLPSIYRASATLQLSRESAKIVNVEDVSPDDNPGMSREFFETQYALLKSRSLAERVVRTLNLDQDDAFVGDAANSGFFRRIASSVLGSSEPDGGQQSVEQMNDRRERAIERLQDMIDIEPKRNSQLVTINVSSTNAEQAAKIANALADGFISANLERRYDASSYARSFLDDRLRELKLKVEDSEKDLVAYAQSASIVNTDDDKSLMSDSIESLTDSLVKIQAVRIEAEELWKQAQGTPGLGLAQIVDNDTIRNLRTELAQATAEYQQKLSQFKPAFPEMVQLKARIDELTLQMNAQADLIKESMKARYEASLQTEKLIQEQLDTTKQALLEERTRSIRYNMLKREVETNKTLYDGLLQRYKEIGIAGGIGASNISVVDQAQVPKVRYSPRISLCLAIATACGLLAGIGSAFTLEMLDDTLKSPDQAEERLGIPVIGAIPLLENHSMAAGLADARSNVSEAYRSLGTALQFTVQGGLPKTILVTSSQPGEGKSTTSVALARNFAQLGYSVLLVEGDFRRPTLHSTFKMDGSVGLADYLSGGQGLDMVCQADPNVPNLTVVFCGGVPMNPVELLASAKMKKFLGHAGQHFDFVVIDGPPVLELADAPLLASMAEGTLMVVSANQVRHSVVRTRLKRLQQARGRILGIVLNKFDMRQANSYYYYTGYYSGAYEYTASVEGGDKPLIGDEHTGDGEVAGAIQPRNDADQPGATSVKA